jgi:hypothetical protein
MRFIKKYSRSINSSNLKSDEHHFSADSLAVAAMVAMANGAELANLLFRVKYGLDATSHRALLEGWKVKVAKKAELRQWPKHITAKKVAELSLGYWLNDVCEPCGGKGFEVEPGTPMLSDVPCKCCKGTAKRPLVCEANWRDYVLGMLEELDEMTRSAGGRAMKRLADDMNL